MLGACLLQLYLNLQYSLNFPTKEFYSSEKERNGKAKSKPKFYQQKQNKGMAQNFS